VRSEPILDKCILATTVQREYGFAIEELTFVPTGWTALNYAVRCVDGRRLFLKLYDADALAMSVANDARFYLPLAAQLCERGILPHIPCPIRTCGGDLSTRCGGYELQLFSYIDGHTLGLGDLSDDVLAELANLVGTLHRSLQLLEFDFQLIEHFDLPF